MCGGDGRGDDREQEQRERLLHRNGALDRLRAMRQIIDIPE
ncbi:hypothetical protein ATSB10_22800 [Dyella thiooxydans]|uniref:Uncharacterized protein n=1 Tax=Dyella thiooxydans TaxID=445710 RepID=A0A160N2C3_9GAMM|nr:hypothetical protein ATSB10_22800 [Dyella thiooxydans]